MASATISDDKQLLESVVRGPRQVNGSAPGNLNNGNNSHYPANRVNLGGKSDSDIATLVRELFTRARDARRPIVSQWRMNYAGLNNRDYRVGASAWDEDASVSSIWPVVASATSWMTDQRPTLQVTPMSEPFTPYYDLYQAKATDMNLVLASVFQNYTLDAEISKGLWDAYSYGIGYFKTSWQSWLADGLGDAAFARVDPFTVYPDPYANSPAELTYIGEARTMTLNDVDRAWPGAKDRIDSAYYLDSTEVAPTKLSGTTRPNGPRPDIAPIANATQQGTVVVGSAGRLRNSPVVTVLEFYIRGYKVEKPDPGETSDPDIVKVCDEWRCVVVAGDAVLVNRPCGGPDGVNAFGTHPYSRLVLFDTGEWYGASLVEKLLPIQRTINWLLSSINRNIYLMGNPVLLEDTNSSSRNKRFTNRPGQRLEARPGGDVKWLSPPQIAPQMAVSLIQYYEGKIETISGLSAMVRGFAPSGRNAQGVLDSVQDAAFVRIRQNLRGLEIALRDVSSKMVAEIAEFYTEPRFVAVIGPDGQKLHQDFQSQHFYAIDIDSPGERIPLRFQLAADAGSQLPTSKQARAALALELFERGALDVYGVLEAVEYPSWANTAQRVMQGQAQAAQNAAAAKQGQGG